MIANKRILLMMAAVVIAATTIFAGCKKDKVKVTGVSVCPTAVMVTVGYSETLLANVTPYDADDRTVAWVSDKPDIASVENGVVRMVDENYKPIFGVVTANKIGEATITCTTNDGGYPAKTTVIVNPAPKNDDCATLVPGFYFGDLTMDENGETSVVGTDKLITVKYHALDSVALSIDEKFKIPQMPLLGEQQMKVNCIANMTKEEGGYKVTGKTKATLVVEVPVTIEGIFNNNVLDMNITVELPAIAGGGIIVVNFKGIWNVGIEPCAMID